MLLLIRSVVGLFLLTLVVGCGKVQTHDHAWIEVAVVRLSSIPGAPEGREGYTLSTSLKGSLLGAGVGTVSEGENRGGVGFMVIDYFHQDVSHDGEIVARGDAAFATIGISLSGDGDSVLCFFSESILSVILNELADDVVIRGSDGSIVMKDDLPIELVDDVIYSVIEQSQDQHDEEI